MSSPASQLHEPGSSAQTSRLTRPLQLAIWLAVLACATYVYQRQMAYVAMFRFDDSYITLRYAQQLVTNGILSFNPDERIDGYTSVGWTLVLAVCEWLGGDGGTLMLTISKLCGCLSVFAAVALARTLGVSWPFTIACAAIGTLFTPGFIVWSVPGMEMPFAALAYTTLLIAMVLPTHASEPRRGASQRMARAALLLLAALARPEGALLAGMLWALELLLMRREHASTPAWLRAARPYFGVALLLGVLMIWRWSFYGYPLPNTFYAKSPTPALVALGIDDARAFVFQRGLFLVPIACLALLASKLALRVRATLVVLAVWFMLVLVVYARSGGDFPGFHRFYQVMVPASYAVFALLGSTVARFAARKLAPRKPVVAPILATLLALPCGSYLGLVDRDVLPVAFERDLGWIRGQTSAVDEWRRAGLALAQVIAREGRPVPSRIAVRAAGAIPYFARADRVYDTLALNNPEVAHNNPPVRDVPAHQKEATTAQIMAWQPNILILHPVIGPGDQSGNPPAWFDAPEFRAAGFVYRCVPMEPADLHFCYWQR